jgi:hypothetical protein
MHYSEHELIFEQKNLPHLLTINYETRYRDEIEWAEQLTGKSITFRGEVWEIDMVAEQESLPDRVAGKKHPEDTKAEFIATESGRQRRHGRGEVVGRDEMVGPLTHSELRIQIIFG